MDTLLAPATDLLATLQAQPIAPGIAIAAAVLGAMVVATLASRYL